MKEKQEKDRKFENKRGRKMREWKIKRKKNEQKKAIEKKVWLYERKKKMWLDTWKTTGRNKE